MKRIISFAVLTALVLSFSGCESKEEKEIRLFKEGIAKEEKARQERIRQKEKWIKTYQSNFNKAEEKTKECEKEKLDPFTITDECRIAMEAYYESYFKLRPEEVQTAYKESCGGKEYHHFKCSAATSVINKIREQEREQKAKEYLEYYEEHFNEAVKMANDYKCMYGGSDFRIKDFYEKCKAAREAVKKKQETETK